MSKRALKAEQWRQEVERWRSRGQTRAAYCAERGLSARRWASERVHGYNNLHRHSAIGFVTPKPAALR